MGNLGRRRFGRMGMKRRRLQSLRSAMLRGVDWSIAGHFLMRWVEISRRGSQWRGPGGCEDSRQTFGAGNGEEVSPLRACVAWALSSQRLRTGLMSDAPPALGAEIRLKVLQGLVCCKRSAAKAGASLPLSITERLEDSPRARCIVPLQGEIWIGLIF